MYAKRAAQLAKPCQHRQVLYLDAAFALSIGEAVAGLGRTWSEAPFPSGGVSGM
jgi:hypothetical protein